MAKPVEQTDGIPIYCAHDAMVATSVLEGNPRNPNRHPDEQIRLLAKIIVTQGWRAPITVSKRSGQIVRGHGRLLAAQAAGLTFCPVDYQDYESDEAEYADLVADNRLAELAELDRPTLKDLLQDLDTGALDMELTGFNEDALAELMEQVHPLELGGEGAGIERQTLADRFIVPPFSVLDARQGYWQARKRAWLALGIESELGRGDSPSTSARADDPTYRQIKNRTAPGGSLRDAASLGANGKTRRGDGKGKTLGAIPPNQATLKSPDYEKRGGNGLLGFSEQARTKYAATSYSSQDRLIALQRTGSGAVYGTAGNASEQSGTSIFDPVLCELVYRWFSPPGAVVLDPFAGGSVRGIVAAKLGRQYAGIDLRAEQIEANEVQAERICDTVRPAWITGDARDVKALAAGEYDLLFSCPPYFDLEVYSDTEGDLSNMGDYAAFITAYRQIIADSVGMLKADRFACFVVGDVRDKKGFYRNFVSDTIAAFEAAGARLYNEAILVTALGSLPIRVGKQFTAGRKLGKTHQNVLVFYKGDPNKVFPLDEAITDEDWRMVLEYAHADQPASGELVDPQV